MKGKPGKLISNGCLECGFLKPATEASHDDWECPICGEDDNFGKFWQGNAEVTIHLYRGDVTAVKGLPDQIPWKVKYDG